MTIHDVDAAMRDAVAMHNAGRFPDAEAIYRQVLAISPDHPDALHLMGLIALQSGDAQAAAGHIAKAIAFRSNDSSFYEDLARALKALGRLDDAIMTQIRATKLAPESVTSWARLGTLYVEAKHWGEAIEPLKMWMTLEPQSPYACNWLGVALANTGDFVSAAQAFQMGIQLQPLMPQLHMNLANALHNLRRLDEAETSARRATELDPKSVEAWTAYSNILSELGRQTEANLAADRATALAVR